VKTKNSWRFSRLYLVEKLNARILKNPEELANVSAAVVGQMKLWLLSLLCHEEISYI
jgi:hypothetical protein